MKHCGYCGRDNDDGAANCRECGTPFVVGQPSPSETSWRFPAIRQVPGFVAGGLAVVSILTGIVMATRRALPAIYLLAQLLLPWLLLLVVVTLCLVLYAATVCCRTQWHRVVFTFAVMAVLFTEWELFFSGEGGLGSHGSPASVYGASALLILAGALTFSRIARRNRAHPPPDAPPITPSQIDPATPAGNSAAINQPPSMSPLVGCTTRNKRQEHTKVIVRSAALVGGLAALTGAGASVLAVLDVIRVEWDNKLPLCAIAAAICLAFLVVCAWAWRLRSGAIQLLCSGYLLVGFVIGLNCALALMLGFPAIGHERQLYAATFAALVSFITGIVVHRQIARLKELS